MLQRIKKWGPFGFGFGVIVLLFVLRFVVESILEAEVQDLWQRSVRPFLFQIFIIRLPFWLVLTILLVVLVIALLYYFARRTPRLVNGRLNFHRIRSPKVGSIPEFDVSQEFDKVDVIKGWARVKDGELNPADFATIVERATNSGNLKSEVGAELLDDFGYELVLRSDKNYEARKKRRRA